MFQFKHTRYILVLGTVFLLNSCQGSSSTKDSTPESSVGEHESNMPVSINSKVDIFMKSLISNNRVPGAVLAIAKDNKVVYRKAFGVRDSQTQKRVEQDTLFHIASTHKAISSLLIATLVDKGILTWDTKAQEIYDGFTLSNETYASEITIRQLLDMTSGLPTDLDVPPSQARGLLEELTNIPLNVPKKQYTYSNLSVSIASYLAVLAEAKFNNGLISEDDLDNLHAGYEALLKRNVLIPIGMNNSYLDIDKAKETNNMSSSHHLENGVFVVSQSEDEPFDVFAPAGGLKSTMNDMIKYMIVETQEGLTTEGKRIVSQKNMMVRQTLSKGVATEEEYGLGLEVKTLSNNMAYIGHTGSFNNFNSAIGFFPNEKISFVLLINGDSEDILKLTADEIEGKMSEWVNEF